MSSAHHCAVAERPVPRTALPERAQSPWQRNPRLLSYAAIALGAFIRAAHVFSMDFPLNDGGLFLRMTQELQAAHYHLPAFTTYNSEAIPFAYSPLGFYITGAINSITGVSLIELFRLIPLAASVGSVVAFYYLARTMLRDERTAAAAVVGFALIPRSYVWLIMGGGVTRAFGFLFAIIALQQAYQLYTRQEWRYAATTALMCALTVLSHLGTANFLAFSIALLFVFYGRTKFGVASSAAVVIGALALTAPWWSTVIAQHGLAPFHAARASSGSVFGDPKERYGVLLQLARFNIMAGGETLFPLVSVLAVVGALASLRPGRFILPVWWVVILVLDSRAGWNYATIPAAMLAGIAVARILIPGLYSLYGRAPWHSSEPALAGSPDPLPSRPLALLRFIPALVLGFLLLYGIATSLTRNADLGGETRLLTALAPASRESMRWVAQHTPPSSRFLVVTSRAWHIDKVAEWFPALANRRSLNTVQGLEWLPGFNERANLDNAMQSRCSQADGSCLSAWAAALGGPFTHVYVPKAAVDPCCEHLIAALRRDPAYAPVYDGPGAFIAAHR